MTSHIKLGLHPWGSNHADAHAERMRLNLLDARYKRWRGRCAEGKAYITSSGLGGGIKVFCTNPGAGPQFIWVPGGLVQQANSRAAYESAVAAVLECIGVPVADWPTRHADLFLCGSHGKVYLKRKDRFELVVFLVLNGTSPEVVTDYLWASRLLEHGPADRVAKRWRHVADIFGGISGGRIKSYRDIHHADQGRAPLVHAGELVTKTGELAATPLTAQLELAARKKAKVTHDYAGKSFAETLATQRAKPTEAAKESASSE